jgi:hypothetical protein
MGSVNLENPGLLSRSRQPHHFRPALEDDGAHCDERWRLLDIDDALGLLVQLSGDPRKGLIVAALDSSCACMTWAATAVP